MINKRNNITPTKYSVTYDDLGEIKRLYSGFDIGKAINTAEDYSKHGRTVLTVYNTGWDDVYREYKADKKTAHYLFYKGIAEYENFI